MFQRNSKSYENSEIGSSPVGPGFLPVGFIPLLIVVLLTFSPSCKRKEEPGKTEASGYQVKFVDARGGLRMRESPSLEARSIHLLADGSEVLVLEEKPQEETLQEKTGRWTRVKQDDREGWVFGAYLVDASDGDELTSVEQNNEMYLEPGTVQPGNFSVKNRSFQLGVGCSGNSHSEYSITLNLDETGHAEFQENNLLEYGDPEGTSCARIQDSVKRGTYSVQKGLLEIHLKEEESAIVESTPPECSDEKRKVIKTPLNTIKRYRLILCDGKRALRELPEEKKESRVEDRYLIDREDLESEAL